VITPDEPIPSEAVFTVTVNYTGRPGGHTDGDGSTEGWFRVNTSAAPNDGGNCYVRYKPGKPLQYELRYLLQHLLDERPLESYGR
jgi:hypothetical protein